MKMIQVRPDTHKLAKDQAKERGMLFSAYIDMLVKQDEKKLQRLNKDEK